MTDPVFSKAWNNLHQAYSLARVISHSADFSSGKDDENLSPNYATLLERQADLLMEVIGLLDSHTLGSAITFGKHHD